eukprot:196878-Hanusia_phi.AAC.6
MGRETRKFVGEEVRRAGNVDGSEDMTYSLRPRKVRGSTSGPALGRVRSQHRASPHQSSPVRLSQAPGVPGPAACHSASSGCSRARPCQPRSTLIGRRARCSY